MNNQQFRRLVLSQSDSQPTDSAPSKNGGATSALGSRQRSSIPMTPRAVGGPGRGVDFAKQLRESQEPARKRFKSSAAPKGSQLAAGYQDRSKALREQGDRREGNEKAERVKALEEQLKLGQIDQALFEKLRDEIVGGDIEHVHLVKGLDRRLLERVRRGEDVLSNRKSETQDEPTGDEEIEEDVDDAFDKVESRELKPLKQDEKSYAKDMAAPTAPTAKKRTRDDILREMKAARAQTTHANNVSEPVLGSRFRKIGAPQPGTSRVEIDEKGREVLHVVDKNGNVKRKVRKTKDSEGKAAGNGLLMPDKGVAPLGMVVPQAQSASKAEEEDDGDIFADAGSDYNPLGEVSCADDSSSDPGSGSDPPSESENVQKEARNSKARSSRRSRSRSRSASYSRSRSRSSRSRSARSHSPPRSSPAKQSAPVAAPRNYFGSKAAASASATAEGAGPANPLQDPTMLAALKRAAGMSSSSEHAGPGSYEGLEAESAKRKRHEAMLARANADRDLDDMDLGFGSSRVGDDEGEDGKVSEWKGLDGGDKDDGEGWKARGGTKKRKRGKKKRNGQGDNAKDVMAVLDRRNK